MNKNSIGFSVLMVITLPLFSMFGINQLTSALDNLISPAPLAVNITITMMPFNPPIVIPTSGGNFSYTVEVNNNEARAMPFDLWTTYTLPDGTTSDPVYGPERFGLPAGWSAVRDDLSEYITVQMPAGEYVYTVNVGKYPTRILGTDSFTVEKLAGGGWYPQSSGSTGILSGVDFLDADHGWSVGFVKIMVNTLDGGDTWHPQDSPAFSHFYDVEFLDLQTGWVVGDLGIVLNTSDGGANWIQKDLGFPGAYYFKDIQFIDANNGWIVGGKPQTTSSPVRVILRTSDGGASWNTQEFSTLKPLLSAVFFVDANNGWVVGEGGTILQTSNGGAIWEEQFSGTPYHLNSVSFTDENNGWIVGDNGTVLQTSDGGVNWAPVDLGTTDYLQSVFFADSNQGWIAGGSGSNVGSILHTDDGGLVWHSQDTGGASILRDIIFVDANQGWAVGYDGTILHTETGGE